MDPKNKDNRWDYEYEYDEYDRYDRYDYNDTSEDDWQSSRSETI